MTLPTYQTTAVKITTNSTTVQSDSATTTDSEVDNQLIDVGSTLFYIVVGAGSGVLVLLLIILIMCASVCYLIADRGKSYTITTDTMHKQQTLSGDRENPEWQWQSEFNVQRL